MCQYFFQNIFSEISAAFRLLKKRAPARTLNFIFIVLTAMETEFSVIEISLKWDFNIACFSDLCHKFFYFLQKKIPAHPYGNLLYVYKLAYLAMAATSAAKSDSFFSMPSPTLNRTKRTHSAFFSFR